MVVGWRFAFVKIKHVSITTVKCLTIVSRCGIDSGIVQVIDCITICFKKPHTMTLSCRKENNPAIVPELSHLILG